MTTTARPSYAGYRFPAEIISHAVWLYFRFPLSLRTWTNCWPRGIVVSHETVRQWAQSTEGSAGAASGMVNGGTEVRASVCQPGPPQAVRSGLRRGQARGNALDRAPEAQGAEQRGGKLAPADPTARPTRRRGRPDGENAR